MPSAGASPVLRQRFAVTGIVQGVGFRPFVYALATRLELSGSVANIAGAVSVEAQGSAAALAEFARALRAEAPPLAAVDEVRVESLPLRDERGFTIGESGAPAAVPTPVPPDVALCDRCLGELLAPTNRRYRYPFINCTDCGPRFTLIEGLPYDRARTTMRAFALCRDCREEYESPANRRFHAEPNACPVCGPQLRFVDPAAPEATATRDDALAAARAALRAGRIVAVKGVGGFHLACDATDDAAVRALRRRKGRGEKPFAVMVPNVAAARRLAAVDADEERLLSGRERPIVLLRARPAAETAPAALSPAVAPGQSTLGLFLPYSPLHVLLCEGLTLVMTSGNRSEEPIAHDDDEALERLAGIADVFLLHDRRIHTVCDDSVVRSFRGLELPLRRSRGYAPFPLRLPRSARPVLAVGAELKATFCLARDRHAFLSQHIGDLGNLETLAACERGEERLEELFQIAPEAVACDLHPGYLSTQWAARLAAARGLERVFVQHHHAHVAALMAEHGLDGARPVLAASFDGTGYGHDGAVWGGEILLADYGGARRLVHLRYAPLPGGDAAVRHPGRMALAHLYAAGIAWDRRLPPVAGVSSSELRVVERQLTTGFATVPTSSMGRLFDAVAALAGLGASATYEGQAAIELEAAVDWTGAGAGYRFALDADAGLIDPAPVLGAIVRDRLRGESSGRISARFHAAVAGAIVDAANAARRATGVSTFGLSGGVFQNVTLLGLAVDGLTAAGFQVLVHSRVPPNDGGVALGQAAVAGFADVDGAGGAAPTVSRR